MDLSDSPAEATFRAEVRAFLDENADKYPNRGRGWEEGDFPGSEAMKPWRDALVDKGWIAPHWPKEYGGAGLSAQEQFVLNEEFAEAGVNNVGGFGVMMIGPTLMVHGTDEQKQEHLTKILHGERNWAQGWSEPGAGSDLASLQTRAIRDGDEYVVNGQKIWTSGAHRADWIYMLARTDPDAPKHRGISLLMFDLKTPGVSIRPLINMADGHAFNEVFFEDVRVPVKNRLGEENRGWYVGMTLTDFERSGIGNAVGVQRILRGLLKQAQTLPAEQTQSARKLSWRLAFADRWIEADIARLFSYLNMTLQLRNLIPNHEASMSKLYTTELNQRIAATTLKLFGLYGQLWDKDRPEALRGAAARGYLGAVSSTIAGGTSEIQRNIIATRGLGLPRG
ncbi:MAG: acyl-CoA dehydrogenase family protein [Dehalococcoidia bacterium]|nr:acyl-CoA dehydrogenase family protein [Dehalococcoidia bacterium]